MIQSPNYIHFRSQWQILGPDSPGQFSDRSRFQELMNILNKEPIALDFDDFTYRSDRCEMGKLRGNRPEGGAAFTKLTYSDKNLTLVEEWADISAQEFKEKFVSVLTAWFQIFPNTAIIAQTCNLRALVQPVNFNDSRQFLGDNILQIGPHMRETFLHGMPFRVGFTFGCVHKLPDCQIFIDTAVNSWRDNRTVWVEVNGISPMSQPINATNTGKTEQAFEACKCFLEDDVIKLLSKFDVVNDNEPKSGDS